MVTWNDLLAHFEGSEVGERLKQIDVPNGGGETSLARVLAHSFVWSRHGGFVYWNEVYRELRGPEDELIAAKEWYQATLAPSDDEILELYRNRDK